MATFVHCQNMYTSSNIYIDRILESGKRPENSILELISQWFRYFLIFILLQNAEYYRVTEYYHVTGWGAHGKLWILSPIGRNVGLTWIFLENHIDAVFLTGSKLLYQIWPPKLFFCTAILISFESLGM